LGTGLIKKFSMKLYHLLLNLMLLTAGLSYGQTAKLSCIENEIKNEEGSDPMLIKTCIIKKFKFVSTSYPDYAGRYVYSEHEVYILKRNKYTRTTNAEVFNKYQAKLLAAINKSILQDFHAFAEDANTKDCLEGLQSIPVYKMNDLEISFQGDEIWFEVHWGLSMACRSVDGTIVTFKVKEIEKYLN
jgi:hypothetical protein